MKQIFAVVVLLVCGIAITNAQSNRDYASINAQTIPGYTDSELKERLSKLTNKVVPPQLTSVVKSYINTYTVKKRQHTEIMLGKINMYFPVFEKYLLEQDMPTDLKYLPVVESALNPSAVSRSGAVGLWQFMPATGKENGLKINSLVDERRDPHKATQAALKYLGRLYKKYGDWSLALAAYNGGPGRVNRAIKRGRSKNFWRIRRYLPRETRNYVPAFIAATYVVHYYHNHNLQPRYPELELQLTATTKIFKRMSFQMISDITGVSMSTIKTLNPSYKQRFLPRNSRGSYLTLPQNAMATLLNKLGRPDARLNHIVSTPIPGPRSVMDDENFVKASYIVQPEETLEQIAEKYDCTPYDILQWNRMTQTALSPGQRLLLYRPKLDRKTLELLAPLPQQRIQLEGPQARALGYLPANNSKIRDISRKYGFSRMGKSGKYVYYQIRRRESLLEVADKFADVSLEDILKLNNIREGQPLQPGTRILIKKQ
ncbi:MAG: transglycosylase SLT domain-containing protein [Bacteroidota bacterium]